MPLDSSTPVAVPEPGILDAMRREAERLAALDPPFTDRTRERLQMLLGTGAATRETGSDVG